MCVLHYITIDVIRPRDVIGHVTIRLSIDDFLYVINRNQNRYLALADVLSPTGPCGPHRQTTQPTQEAKC